MSNIFINRLSAVLSDSDFARIEAMVTDLRSVMPYLVGLTDEERRTLPMIRRNNKLFVDEAVRLVRANQDYLPPYFDSNEMVRDLELHDKMLGVERLLAQLYEQVVHTRMLAGNEAYRQALLFYQLSKSAAASGVSGSQSVVDSLGERFEFSRKPQVEEDDMVEDPA